MSDERVAGVVVQSWLEENCRQGAAEANLASDTNLVEAGILDSIQTLELVKYLEARFEISIPLEELYFENFETVAAVEGMVERLVVKND